MRAREPDPTGVAAQAKATQADPRGRRAMGRASALGFELVGLVAAGGAIGYFLDRRYDTKPWLLAGGVILFSLFGLVRLVVEAHRLGQRP